MQQRTLGREWCWNIQDDDVFKLGNPLDCCSELLVGERERQIERDEGYKAAVAVVGLFRGSNAWLGVYRLWQVALLACVGGLTFIVRERLWWFPSCFGITLLQRDAMVRNA